MNKRDQINEAFKQYIEQIVEDGKILYCRGRVLGKGGFAKCYEVRQQLTGKKYACKSILKQTLSNPKIKQKLQIQISIHKSLNHEYIVKFYKAFEDASNIHILLQLCTNNTMSDLLKRRKYITQVQTRYYMYQILQAIQFLHSSNIVHRDIKLQNFLLSEQLQIKIGDFGLATKIQKQNKRKRTTVCGTPNYMAPQILQQNAQYSYQVDIWSLGIVAYLLLYGKYPFQSLQLKHLKSKITTQSYLVNNSISSTTKNFISKMLKINPHERSNAKQLLKHDFLCKFQIPKNIPKTSLACIPNINFIQNYKFKKQVMTVIQIQQFIFMLQSKQSKKQKQICIQNNNQDIKQTDNLLLDNEQVVGLLAQSFEMIQYIKQIQQLSTMELYYQTTNSSHGLLFNDSSNLKLTSQKYKFVYFSIQKDWQIIQLKNYNIQNDKQQILTKCKILLQYKQKKIQKTINNCTNLYILRFIQSVYGKYIWLSNGILQIIFKDETILIMSQSKWIYIDEQKNKIIFNPQKYKEQSFQIKNKVKMITETINIYLNLNQNNIQNKNQYNSYNKQQNKIQLII